MDFLAGQAEHQIDGGAWEGKAMRLGILSFATATVTVGVLTIDRE